MLMLCMSVSFGVPTISCTQEPGFTQAVAAQVLLLTVTKGLEWLTKEEHICPVNTLRPSHPFIIDYFKALSNASDAYVSNLKTLHNIEPENKEVSSLLIQAIILQKKFALKLEEAETMSSAQRVAYELAQQYHFTPQDLRILAQLKAREYKDVPVSIQWESKKDEYVEVSPGIFYPKKLLTPQA